MINGEDDWNTRKVWKICLFDRSNLLREQSAFLHLIPCQEKFRAITFGKESETATSALDLRVTRCLIRDRYTQDVMRKQTEVRNGLCARRDNREVTP